MRGEFAFINLHIGERVHVNGDMIFGLENEAGLENCPLTLRAGTDGSTTVELIEHGCLDVAAQE